MARRGWCVLFWLLGAGCKEGTGSTPTIVAPSDPTTAPKPSPAPSAPRAVYPPLTDACSTDADCDSTNYGSDCCFRCETAVGDKAWVAKVAEYCSALTKAGEDKDCPAVNCSREGASPSPLLAYKNANPKCSAGHCIKPH
jgi:hypothetical protein